MKWSWISLSLSLSLHNFQYIPNGVTLISEAMSYWSLGQNINLQFVKGNSDFDGSTIFFFFKVRENRTRDEKNPHCVEGGVPPPPPPLKFSKIRVYIQIRIYIHAHNDKSARISVNSFNKITIIYLPLISDFISIIYNM